MLACRSIRCDLTDQGRRQGLTNAIGGTPQQRAGVLSRRRLLCGLVSLLVFLVQASHPALHPLEVIDAGADGHVGCPVSHVSAELSLPLPVIWPRHAVLWHPPEPLPWLSHAVFMHGLAPRPPPFACR
jgi:hypothetical protein